MSGELALVHLVNESVDVHIEPSTVVLNAFSVSRACAHG